MNRLRITATLSAALLLTTGTQVAAASQRLAAGTLVPNVTPTATLTVLPTQTTAPVGASIDLSAHVDLSDGTSPAPSLTLGTSAATILIGGHVTLTATLGAWHSNDQVSIYGTTGGGAPQLVGSGAVDLTGIFGVSLSPAHNTVYSASWAGDDTYLPATSAPRPVSVRAKVGIVQSGYYRSSRGVRLYHYHACCWTRATHCPRFTARLLPSMAGKGILFTLQRRSSGHWRTVTTGTIGTNVNGLSAAIYKYRGTVLIGKTMRVKASWAGDSGNLGGHSNWTSFRLTR